MAEDGEGVEERVAEKRAAMPEAEEGQEGVEIRVDCRGVVKRVVI